MVLHGAIGDFDVAEVVQLVSAGHRTGELILVSAGGESRLYFDGGKITHARLGSQSGRDVLAEIVGWDEGEFEFRPGVRTDERTIAEDVPRVLMRALKLRDERALSERAHPPKAPAAQWKQAGRYPRLHERLAAFLEANPPFEHVCIRSFQEGTIASRDAPGTGPDKFESLCRALHVLAEHYPGKELRRLLVEDGLGTAVLAPVRPGVTVVAVANSLAPLGAVTLNVKRLASWLAELDELEF